MRLFAPSLAFVDLETTGMSAPRDRITEIGIVRVDADAADRSPQVREWTTLVDPEMPIPPAIQALTGITDSMVAGAPTFSQIRSTGGADRGCRQAPAAHRESAAAPGVDRVCSQPCEIVHSHACDGAC
ncbi:MAG: 3'-5' exonuclease [Burkholderiales bacterium]|nr:3'-5' exonuclease [Burkholderiales bacterium]